MGNRIPLPEEAISDMDSAYPSAGTISYFELLEQGLHSHRVKEILF